MTRPWNIHDDFHIVTWFETLGANELARYPLPFTAATIRRRVKKLRETGAWEHINEIERAVNAYGQAIGDVSAIYDVVQDPAR